MNNTFNLKRFAMILKKDAQDLSGKYIKLLLIVTITFLVIFFLSLLGNIESFKEYNSIRYAAAFVFIWGGTILAPFQLYKHYNNRMHGTAYFMLPASQTEKWLSMLFYCAVATPVVLAASVTIIDICLYPVYIWENKTLLIATYTWQGTGYAIISILAAQALFFLGNIWFQQSKVQKTIGALCIFSVAYIVLILILNSTSDNNNFSGYGTFSGFVQIPNISAVQTIISCIIAPVGLWAVSFIRMKEQQL